LGASSVALAECAADEDGGLIDSPHQPGSGASSGASPTSAKSTRRCLGYAAARGPVRTEGPDRDGAGQVRLVAEDAESLEALLASDLDGRGRFEPGATPSRDEPYLVVVVDGARLPHGSRLAGGGYHNPVILNVSPAALPNPGRTTLRLDVTAEQIEMVSLDRGGAESRSLLGRPDRLSVTRAAARGRRPRMGQRGPPPTRGDRTSARISAGAASGRGLR